MKPIIEWREQIDRALAEAEVQHLDLLLDQAGWAHSAIAALQQLSPAVPWYSLYSGTPEESLLHHAPILMRLDLQHWQHKAWLEELIDVCLKDSRLLLLVSPLPFDTLCLHLQALSQVQWGGVEAVLRHHDPRIFPELLGGILTPEQCSRFQQLASYWSWLDRDGQPQWMAGTHDPDSEYPVPPSGLVLSDRQYERVCCIVDAQGFLDDARFSALGESREQRFAHLYRLACEANDADDFGPLDAYLVQRLEVN